MPVQATQMTKNRVGIAELQLRISNLSNMPIAELWEEYERVFEETTASRNKRYLVRRIAYRLQEQAYGGLSRLAQERIEELARNAPIRRSMLKILPGGMQESSRPVLEPESKPKAPIEAPPRRKHDERLPATGTVLKKTVKGIEHEVKVLDAGFEMGGKAFLSLSSVAKAITGTNWNGFQFFAPELKAAKGEQP